MHWLRKVNPVKLAKKLGAGLAVETVVGAGSTFTILLPVRSAATTPANN